MGNKNEAEEEMEEDGNGMGMQWGLLHQQAGKNYKM